MTESYQNPLHLDHGSKDDGICNRQPENRGLNLNLECMFKVHLLLKFSKFMSA